MPDTGQAYYSEYVKDQIAEEDARKESIERRGIAVITSSGTLVSLLFALVAVLTGVKNYALPSNAESWLMAALIAFVVAALLGIVTNMPLLYKSARVPELEKLLDKFWADERPKAELRIASTRLNVLKRARLMNTTKGWILVAAVAAQLAAVVFLAFAVGFILDKG